jgi:hypothetical protein
MTKRSTPLSWCVGTFVYQRGSSTPLHFTPLKPFLLESALDLSLVLGLKACADAGLSLNDVSIDLANRMGRLRIEDVGRLIREILEADDSISSVIEIYSGCGILAEYLRYVQVLHKEPRSNFVAVDSPDFELHFSTFHGAAVFCHDTDLGSLNQRAAIAVLNHNTSVRRSQMPSLHWSDALNFIKSPAIVSMRVALDSAGTSKTSVHGCTVSLPVDADVRSFLMAENPNWQFCLYPDDDSSLFLPSDGETGWLLGASVGRPFSFQSLDAVRRR